MVGAPPAADPVARLRLSPLFDVDFYTSALAARGQTLDGLAPADHYWRRGEAARVPPHPLFDPGFYAEHNLDVVAAGVNLLQHYLDNGHREGRDPHPLVDLKLLKSQLAPDFFGDPLTAYLLSKGPLLRPHRHVDPAYIAAQQRRLDPRDERPALLFYLASDPDAINPSAEFDGAGYRLLYPDARGVNPLIHFVRYGEAMGRRATKDRGAIGRAAAQIEKASALDPDIVKPFADFRTTPLMNGYDLARREFRLYRLLAKATGRHPHTHVILTPWLKRGGADRAVLHVARGLLESDPDLRVLIVCTQDDGVEALDWAPVSQRLSIAKIAHEVDDIGDTYVAFCNFLRFTGCRHLYVVNSRFGWDLIEKYGHVLKSLMRLYGFAFCQDYDEAGRRAGYSWTRLGRTIDHLAAVVSDNSLVMREFAADHAFGRDDLAKAFVLPLPVDARLEGVAAEAVRDNLLRGERRRRQVFWAGRFTAQKALDVAAEAARLAPEIDLCAYGGAAADSGLKETGNFRLAGAYGDFADLPLHEASLFLHTARWEGLPNVLLEAGAAGLPIVTRDVGGIADLVDETTGWPVPREAGAEGFVAAIRDALARPEEALARAQRMRDRIATRHSHAAFAAALHKLTTGGDGA